MTIEYTEELCRYPQDVLRPAMRHAWMASRQWFPTLGTIVECCDAIERSQVIPESHQIQEEGTLSHAESKVRVREIIDNLAASKDMKA